MPIDQNPLPGASAPQCLSAALSLNGNQPDVRGVVYPPASLPARAVCRICTQIITEMVMLTSDRIQVRRDRRRTLCHIRQISMYVCHVALQIQMQDIGQAFGRDRTTVGHACHVVEDRRDDPAFDDFVSAVERTVNSVFRSGGVPGHE